MCYSHSKEHPLPTGKDKKLTIKVSTILSQRVGMFSSRIDCTKALEYAQGIAKAEGMPEGLMSAAIMVYHNTLLEALAKGATEKEYNMVGVISKTDNSEEHF